MTSASTKRLVLITGASAGIGRASASAFARRGYRVLAVARRRELLDELAAEQAGAASVIAIPADISEEASTAAMSRRVLDEFGVPDVVVANAGIGLDALFTETSNRALRRLFEVNFFGVIATVKPFLPGMLERGSGRLLIVSSIVGKRGIPHYSAYSASKFALHGLADSLRSELIGSGVTVGLICPSTTDTDFQKRALREGPSQNSLRPRQHSAEAVAEFIVKMAGSTRHEVIVGIEAKLLHLANRIAPKWVDRLLARTLVSK